jgi:hypothetical protein
MLQFAFIVKSEQPLRKGRNPESIKKPVLIKNSREQFFLQLLQLFQNIYLNS